MTPVWVIGGDENIDDCDQEATVLTPCGFVLVRGGWDMDKAKALLRPGGGHCVYDSGLADWSRVQCAKPMKSQPAHRR
jgi:hypothetical protein